MIPVPDAQAAYDRVTHFIAEPGDIDLLIAAAAQGGMPQPIVDLGSDLQASKDTHAAYVADPTESNATAWMAADTALREYISSHTDLTVA
jgi:hypothetical protein